MPAPVEEVNILKEVVLPAALALIMLGMGLSLTIQDFKRVLAFPKAVVLGVFNQLILLPIIAFALLQVFGLEGGLAVGLVVIAACPGGATSNLITHVAKGDTALSVTLTAISSIVTIFTIPLIVNYGLETFMGNATDVRLPLDKTIGALFLIILVPVGIGMLIKRYKNEFALKADKPVRIASIIIFVAIIAAIVLRERQHIAGYFEQAGVLALTLNVITMGLGFGLAKMFKLKRERAITISIESGIQNGTLAILIIETLIPNSTPDMLIVPAVYSLIMFFTGGFMMGYFGRKKA